MAEQHQDEPEELREIARERVAHLPAETAGGRVDPAGAGTRSETREESPGEAAGSAQGIGDMPRSGADLGDRGTGGEAAREAIGVEPAGSGGEVGTAAPGRRRAMR
ncbi:hypothetical protein ACIBAI_06790 [Streptomyces sp. NPDC051041]|uniref:hypothetical protein n=1 Tax=Streptomyces sp. NPDC051041 TaxID=3365640 RepID=UPI0037AAC604